MECSNIGRTPKEHITAIFEDFEASARVLQTLTNLSNTVIETALSGQCKFLFEILQNADDAFDGQSKCRNIKLQLILLDNYFIIQHNGKVFDDSDVERICDYASQIEEVKANDLNKTGYKGLGFKSLFNLSDCIYIYSNGYSFRFDKDYWSDPEKKPWQVIPIWCDDLPLSEKYTYDQPVNFIMKISDKKQLNIQLKELVDRPEILLYLHRVNSVYLNLNGTEYTLERKIEVFGLFQKILFLKNQCLVNTWLSRTYERGISPQVKKCIQDVSQFIFPDKIKNAKEIIFTFALCTDKMNEVLRIDGVCYSTLPTQLQLSLPYHVNSNFILNLDRTQFHENEWNEFLIYQIGYLQLNFLKDLAEVPYLKNFVIELLVRKINHPYNVFNKAFSKGYEEAKREIAWLPAYKESCLLKLGEVWVDKIHFFRQNFKNIQDGICSCLIDYDLKGQNHLIENEAKYFDYDLLFDLFPQNYYPQLTENSYIKFLSYLYEISKVFPLGSNMFKLMNTSFLKTKAGALISPTKALLEEDKNPIPDFAKLNPVDNKYFPVSDIDSFKSWLVYLGAKRLDSPILILRESVFQWIKSGTLHREMNINNHMAIINYLAENLQLISTGEIGTLRDKLLILTKSNKFKVATSCCLPNAIPLGELEDVISDDEVISTCYDIHSLRKFFIHLGILESLSSIEVFRKFILVWIKNNEMRFTKENYKPIIEFLSLEHKKINYLLKEPENELLKKMPVLTCAQIFQEANVCYFDTAVPDIKEFENIIEKCKLVSTQNLNENVIDFLATIGVSKSINPVYILRNSILKWIQEGTVQSRINLNNHHDILKYVAQLWVYSYGLEAHEKEVLRKLLVLTKSNVFREACTCYWQTTNVNRSDEEIPKLESIISADELISSEYFADEKEIVSKIKELLNDLGVRHLRFIDIYDRYCDHLTDLNSIKWFFSNLIKYWEKFKQFAKSNQLLNDLKVKLYSSCLFGRNGKVYPFTELYSSCFSSMYKIDENAVPFLAYENLPEDLEMWLGIKKELELPCIIKLLESADNKQNLGEEVTLTFFRTLLEQLRLKDKNEIKKYALKLLSNDNKLTLAKDLYYFTEEDATCISDSCYLKRIHGMSHNETLELAKLCGVNLIPFNQEVNYGEKTHTCDNSLKEFYLERLPLIVLQESKELNELPNIVLKDLFPKVCSIELYKCHNIVVKYPFGNPVETRCYFDLLKIDVIGSWKSLKTKIHTYIKEKLKFISDITEILDMESYAEEKTVWLHYHKEDSEKLLMIEEELNKLLSGQEINYIGADFVDEGINNIELSLKQDKSLEQVKATAINPSENSGGVGIVNNDSFKQNVYIEEIKTTTLKHDVNSVGESLSDKELFFEQVIEQVSSSGNQTNYSNDSNLNFNESNKEAVNPDLVAAAVDQSVSSESESITNNDSFKQDVYFGQLKTTTFRQSINSASESLSDNDFLLEQVVEQIGTIIAHQCADFKDKKIKDDTLMAKDVNLGSENLNSANQIDESEDSNLNSNELNNEAVNCDLVKSSIFPYQSSYSKNKIDLSSSELQSKQSENLSAIDNQLFSITASGNSQDSIPLLKDVNVELEKPTYDNTLKEFYLQRLPFIFQCESKKQNHTSEKILKSLYIKICSIELYQCSDIHIQYPHSFAAETYCFFDDLKIYVVGKWSDRKLKIHQYIKEKLCLHIDVKDIINMEPVTHVVKTECISPKKNEPQKLHETEKGIKTCASAEETLTNELQENKQIIAEASPDGNSIDNINYRPCLLSPYYSIKFKGSEAFITFTERTGIAEHYDSICDPLDEDALKVDMESTPNKPPILRKTLDIHPDRVLQEITDDEPHLKRLCEKYVFIFLQDYYKNKYPDAQFNLVQGHFTLQWQSHTTEIIWLNESENKGLEYDLLMKKNDEVKHCIEVKSLNQANKDLFDLADCIRRNQSTAENSEYNAKYCVYCALYEVDSSVSEAEKMTNIKALYKIVPLKLPSI